MDRVRRKGLSFRTVLILSHVLVAASPAGLVGAYFYTRVMSSAQKEIIEANRSQVARAREALSASFEQADRLSEWLLVSRTLGELLRKPPARVREYDATMRNTLENLGEMFAAVPIARYVSALLILGDNGLDIRYGFEGYLIDPPTIRKSAWFLGGIAADGMPYWGSLLENPSKLASDRYVIPTVRSIKDMGSGVAVGQAVLLLRRSFYDDCIKDAAFIGGGDIHIVDASGRIVSSSLAERFLEPAAVLAEGPAGPRNAGAMLLEERLGSRGIRVVARLDTAPLQNQTAMVARSLSPLLALAILLSVLLSFLMALAFLRPIGLLMGKLGRIAAGDFRQDPIRSRIREIQALSESTAAMARDIERLIREGLVKEQEKRTAEIKMLQLQMNPHFLANTLNSIKYMATLQGAAGIALMVERLGRIVRAALRDRDEMIPLGEELAVMEDFMQIQRVRYKGRIAYRTRVQEEALLECRVPRFILQPILENAVLHGLGSKEDGGDVVVDVRRSDGFLVLSVSDDGVGMARGWGEAFRAAPGENAGMALANIDRRLKLVYGGSCGLSIRSGAGERTEVGMRIPLGENGPPPGTMPC